jgi:hypothetical protein
LYERIYHGGIESTGETREDVLPDGGVGTKEMGDTLLRQERGEEWCNIWKISL